MVGETLRPERKDDDALSFDERMRKVFEDAYESGELPHVSFAVFLSEHGTPEDLEALPELLEKTDVYIPEAPRHTREDLKFYRDVAAGKIIPEEAMRGDSWDLEYQFLLSKMQILYGTDTAVTFIDTPRGNKIVETLIRLADEDRREIKIGKAFDELLDAVKITSRKVGEAQRDREEYMLSQVVPQLKKILDACPELKQKKELAVLLHLGSVHTGVQHLLLNAVQKSKRAVNVVPVIFNYGQEGMRRYRFGKKVEDQLAAKIAFEDILDDAFGKQLRAITRYSYKILAIERLIAARFDFGEMRTMLEAAKDLKSFAALVESRLSDKSMAIPTSEAELDGMLPGTLKRKDTPLPDARRIERMNFYTLSWAVPKIIDKLCGGKIYRGDQPFEIVYDDPVTGTSTRIEIRRSNHAFDIERGRDWFSIKINAGEKTGLWPEYRFDLYEGTWRYSDPQFISGHGFKHHAKGLQALCKILLEATTRSSQDSYKNEGVG